MYLRVNICIYPTYKLYGCLNREKGYQHVKSRTNNWHMWRRDGNEGVRSVEAHQILYSSIHPREQQLPINRIHCHAYNNPFLTFRTQSLVPYRYFPIDRRYTIPFFSLSRWGKGFPFIPFFEQIMRPGTREFFSTVALSSYHCRVLLKCRPFERRKKKSRRQRVGRKVEKINVRMIEFSSGLQLLYRCQ